jgi:hypothetical protein
MSFNGFSVKKLLEDFGVKSENDLQEKLYNESVRFPCECGCNHEYPAEDIVVIHGNIYSKRHINLGNDYNDD